MKSLHLLATLLSVGALLGGCSQRTPPHRYEFVIRVQSDPGRPLAEAQVRLHDRVVGRSDEQGQVKLGAHGQEGQTLKFQVECPPGFLSPEGPVTVHLRKSSDGSRRPEYPVTCTPSERTMVIAVRAVNGPNLPVRYLGQEVARTDDKGAAHVLLKAAPNDDIQLTLDTSGSPRLMPQNPSVRFQAQQYDDILLFDHEFVVVEPPKKRPVRAAKATRSGPVPIR